MTDITERLRSLYVQHGTDYVQEAADEIERLRDELSDATIKLENEKLGAEEIYQENDRLMHDCQNFLNEIARLTAERDQAKEAIQKLNEGRPLGDIVGLHTAQNALAEIERLRAERDRALDRIAAMAAELDTPYAWHHLHHGLRYERGEGEGWWPLYMVTKPEDV